MTTDTKKMIERIPLEVFNNDNFGLVDELLTTDFVEHTPQLGVAPTREGFKATAIALKKAFPDLRYTIEDSIESGDRIVHRVKAAGTMKADFMGMRATGQRAVWNEIHIGRVANGRLAEHWFVADQLNMLVQLGVIEAPARVAVAVYHRTDTRDEAPAATPGLSCVLGQASGPDPASETPPRRWGDSIPKRTAGGNPFPARRRPDPHREFDPPQPAIGRRRRRSWRGTLGCHSVRAAADARGWPSSLLWSPLSCSVPALVRPNPVAVT